MKNCALSKNIYRNISPKALKLKLIIDKKLEDQEK